MELTLNDIIKVHKKYLIMLNGQRQAFQIQFQKS